MAVQKILWSTLMDVADTSLRYGVYSDVITGEAFVKTSGSSTTVSSQTAANKVFQGRANGDLIMVNVDGTWTKRIITDATLAPDSVVVGSAVDWSNGTTGRAWSYQDWANGTTATDGWFAVGDLDQKAVHFEWVTKNATSADVSIQGRINGGLAAVLYAKNYTAIAKEIFVIAEWCNEIRVGININTDAGVNNFNVTFGGETFGRL